MFYHKIQIIKAIDFVYRSNFESTADNKNLVWLKI